MQKLSAPESPEKILGRLKQIQKPRLEKLSEINQLPEPPKVPLRLIGKAGKIKRKIIGKKIENKVNSNTNVNYAKSESADKTSRLSWLKSKILGISNDNSKEKNRLKIVAKDAVQHAKHVFNSMEAIEQRAREITAEEAKILDLREAVKEQEKSWTEKIKELSKRKEIIEKSIRELDAQLRNKEKLHDDMMRKLAKENEHMSSEVARKTKLLAKLDSEMEFREQRTKEKESSLAILEKALMERQAQMGKKEKELEHIEQRKKIVDSIEQEARRNHDKSIHDIREAQTLKQTIETEEAKLREISENIAKREEALQKDRERISQLKQEIENRKDVLEEKETILNERQVHINEAQLDIDKKLKEILDLEASMEKQIMEGKQKAESYLANELKEVSRLESVLKEELAAVDAKERKVARAKELRASIQASQKKLSQIDADYEKKCRELEELNIFIKKKESEFRKKENDIYAKEAEIERQLRLIVDVKDDLRIGTPPRVETGIGGSRHKRAKVAFVTQKTTELSRQEQKQRQSFAAEPAGIQAAEGAASAIGMMINDCKGLISAGDVENAKKLYDKISKRLAISSISKEQKRNLFLETSELYNDIHLTAIEISR